MDSQLIDIANCKTCKNILLVVDNAILIRYYSHTAKTRGLYELINGPADNPPSSDGLGVYPQTVPKLTVLVYWQLGPPMSQRFGSDPYPDLKSLSWTVANTTCGKWTGSWHDLYLSGSSYNMQIADWEGCYGVATFNYVGEYHWRVGDYVAEWLSWDYWWWTEVVSITETEFSAVPPIRNPDNFMTVASSAYFSPWNNPGCYNAPSGRHSRGSSARWHMALISNWLTCWTRQMRISPRRIWTPALMRQKTDGLSTLFHMIPWHPERNYQAMANTHTADGVMGCWISPSGTRLKTVLAGKLQQKRKFDSNFKSQLHWDSIHSMTGAIRQCGCFQVRLKIQWMIL